MPDKFHRPTDPADALYHDVLCGNIESVQKTIHEHPELVKGQAVVAGAWSHGGRRCAAQDDVITCLHLLAENGANFGGIGAGAFDSAFKAFPRAAALLFAFGADANKPDDAGATGLHHMSAIGNRYACEVLSRNGANIKVKNGKSETPLDVAVTHNLPRMVRFLRQHGAESATTKSDNDLLQPIRRDIQLSENQFSGEVTWYRADRGYGYLRDYLRESPQDGVLNGLGVYGELFFDREHIVGHELRSIEEGTPVSFEVAQDKFGLLATNVEFGT